MFKKLFILFKIARKLALSDALKVISKQHQPPFIIKILLNLFSISFSKNNYQTNKLTEEEKLCSSIQEWGQHLLNWVNSYLPGQILLVKTYLYI